MLTGYSPVFLLTHQLIHKPDKNWGKFLTPCTTLGCILMNPKWKYSELTKFPSIVQFQFQFGFQFATTSKYIRIQIQEDPEKLKLYLSTT